MIASDPYGSLSAMNRLHFITGSVIFIFILTHLGNHLAGFLSADSHINLMNALRKVYRNPVIETVLLLSILSQVISGLTLFIHKRKFANEFFGKLQLWSGLYLAAFFLIHVSAVMIGRYFLNLDTNFYFGAAGLNVFPINLFFIPYYGLAILAFFGHLSAIHFRKMKFQLLGISVSNQSKAILLMGIFVTVMILYGLTNGFTGADIPKEYHILVGK